MFHGTSGDRSKERNYNMRKYITLILTVFTFAVIISGCGNETIAPTPTADAAAAMQSEPIQAAPTQELPIENEINPAENTQIPDVQSSLTFFESDYGYSISYEEGNTDYRRTEGYDEYILKSDAQEAPFVFVCISRIDAPFVEQVAAASLGEQPESCTVGQTQLPAQCSEQEEAWDDGKIIRKNYICKLDSGDALLIETQRYTQDGIDVHERWIAALVNSITA